VRVLALQEFGRLDGERPEVAIRARRAVDRNLELSALWSVDVSFVGPVGQRSVSGGQSRPPVGAC
jgi:hypothetical protein